MEREMELEEKDSTKREGRSFFYSRFLADNHE
jgi:hypothetical protein